MLINSFEVTMHIERCRFLHMRKFLPPINQIENLHLCVTILLWIQLMNNDSISFFSKRLCGWTLTTLAFWFHFHIVHCTIRKLRCRKHWLWILLHILLRRFLFKLSNEITLACFVLTSGMQQQVHISNFLIGW